MKTKTLLTMIAAAAGLQFAPTASAQDDDARSIGSAAVTRGCSPNLSPDERAKLRAAHHQAMADPAVQAAKDRQRPGSARVPRAEALADAAGGSDDPADPRQDAARSRRDVSTEQRAFAISGFATLDVAAGKRHAADRAILRVRADRGAGEVEVGLKIFSRCFRERRPSSTISAITISRAPERPQAMIFAPRSAPGAVAIDAVAGVAPAAP